MSDIGGGIRSLKFTSNSEVEEGSMIEINTIMDKYPGHAITGFGFDPFEDPENPAIYVAHAPMFYWQNGDCFSPESDYAEFIGVLSKLTGPPDFKNHEVVVDGLPMSNHDHGINGVSFDNSGNLFFPIGAMTNMGWPVCILGGLPESHYSSAVVKVELRNPKRTKTLEWVDYFTRELIEEPNQVVADNYDVAPWVTGIYPYSFGFRNAYDTVYTTGGQLWVSQNGWNEGYGLAINGPPPSGCEYDGWDKSSYASAERGMNPFWKGEEKCLPVLADDWTDPDRIFETFFNAYHGLPNAARARNMGDDRQWYVKDANAPHDPPKFYQGYSWESSTNGIAEFRGNCFAGAMRGDLLGAKWNGWIYRVDIPYLPEEEGEDVYISHLEGGEVAGLEVVYGPGCSILTLDYTYNHLKHIMADDEDAKSNAGPTAYDITPWRGNYIYEQKVIIGGYNFNGEGKTKPDNPRKATKFVIQGVDCTIVSQTDTRIEGVIPAVEQPAHVEELVDVIVHFDDGTKTVLPDSWLWANPGPALEPKPARPAWQEIGEECFDMDTDYARDAGADIDAIEGVKNSLACHLECAKNADCQYFTFNKADKNCYLKGAKEPVVTEDTAGLISGPKFCSGIASVCYADGFEIMPGEGGTLKVNDTVALPEGTDHTACPALCVEPQCTHFVYTEATCQVIGSDENKTAAFITPAESAESCAEGETFVPPTCTLMKISGPKAEPKINNGWYKTVSGPADCPGRSALNETEAADEAETKCPDDFKPIGGKCYQIVFDRKTFDEAAAICKLMGDDVVLAQPKTEEDSAALATLWCDGSEARDCTVPVGGTNDVQYFIGVQKSGDAWQWLDGAAASYTDFDDSLTAAGGSCGIFHSMATDGTPLGKWGSIDCAEPRFFVCELDLDPPAAPKKDTSEGDESGEETDTDTAETKAEEEESGEESDVVSVKKSKDAPAAQGPKIGAEDKKASPAVGDKTEPADNDMDGSKGKSDSDSDSDDSSDKQEKSTKVVDHQSNEEKDGVEGSDAEDSGSVADEEDASAAKGKVLALRIKSIDLKDIKGTAATESFKKSVQTAIASDFHLGDPSAVQIRSLIKPHVIVLFSVPVGESYAYKTLAAAATQLDKAKADPKSVINRSFKIDHDYPSVKDTTATIKTTPKRPSADTADAPTSSKKDSGSNSNDAPVKTIKEGSLGASIDGEDLPGSAETKGLPGWWYIVLGACILLAILAVAAVVLRLWCFNNKSQELHDDHSDGKRINIEDGRMTETPQSDMVESSDDGHGGHGNAAHQHQMVSMRQRSRTPEGQQQMDVRSTNRQMHIMRQHEPVHGQAAQQIPSPTILKSIVVNQATSPPGASHLEY